MNQCEPPEIGFCPQTALEIAKSIAVTPRQAGSDEEREALEIIDARLRQANFRVERPAFSFTDASSTFLRILILVILGLIITLLILHGILIQVGGSDPDSGFRRFYEPNLETVKRWLEVGAVVLSVVTLFLIGSSNRLYRWVRKNSLHRNEANLVTWGQKFCRKIGPKYTTTNLVARMNRNGTDEVEDDPSKPGTVPTTTAGDPPLLILVAHTDTKSQNIPLVLRIGLFSLAIPAALACVMALLFTDLEP